MRRKQLGATDKQCSEMSQSLVAVSELAAKQVKNQTPVETLSRVRDDTLSVVVNMTGRVNVLTVGSDR